MVVLLLLMYNVHAREAHSGAAATAQPNMATEAGYSHLSTATAAFAAAISIAAAATPTILSECPPPPCHQVMSCCQVIMSC